MQEGFTRILVLKGGYNEWRAAKLPVEKKKITGKDRDCVTCHQVVTPGLVRQWQGSRHFPKEVSCAVCHAEDHSSMADVSQVRQVVPDLCMMCHKGQGDQFIQGKHAIAWRTKDILSWAHGPDLARKRDCERCHLIGLKSEEAVRTLKERGRKGIASCEACHPLHGFEAARAREDATCQRCHQAPGLDAWDGYQASVHGRLRQKKSSDVPGCVDCHMAKGNHAVDTPGGYWSVSLPLPRDQKWAQARQQILFSLGLLDRTENSSVQANWLRQNCLLKFSPKAVRQSGEKMYSVCLRCHERDFVQTVRQKIQEIVRQADLLLARALQARAPGVKIEDLAGSGDKVHRELYQLYLLRQKIVHYAVHQAFDQAGQDLVQLRLRSHKLTEHFPLELAD